MFDLRTRLFFDRRLPKTTANPVWWKKAEPFWSKSAKQGRKVALFNWQNCRLSETTLSRDADCRPYKFRGDDKRIQSRQKIARLFDEAFNLLYRKQYDVAVVRMTVLAHTHKLCLVAPLVTLTLSCSGVHRCHSSRGRSARPLVHGAEQSAPRH